VTPWRAASGQRIYSDADIERLRLLHQATLPGRAISQVARLGTDELAALVREDETARQLAGPRDRTPDSGAAENDIERALASARALDGWELEGLLRRTAAVSGMAVFLDSLAAPLLQRIDGERQAGRLSAAQERLATFTVRRVLDGALLSLVTPPGAPKLLVATPAGERQELEAMLVAAAAAVERWQVTYLGPNLPASEIAAAAGSTAAQAVGVSVTQIIDRESILAELRQLRASLPGGVPLLVGGVGARRLATTLHDPGIHVVEDLFDLRAVLRNDLRARSP
jgi:MerR family transcriptional regulator, light-induced transcriptional regulator